MLSGFRSLGKLRTTAFLTEGEKRRLYSLEDGTIIKVPKTSFGYTESETEFQIYSSLPEEIKKHICPILHYEDGCIQVKKATPLSLLYQQGDIQFEDMESMIASKWFIVEYLEKHYDVDPKELTFGMNWGMLDGEVVILDFGCKKGDCK